MERGSEEALDRCCRGWDDVRCTRHRWGWSSSWGDSLFVEVHASYGVRRPYAECPRRACGLCAPATRSLTSRASAISSPPGRLCPSDRGRAAPASRARCRGSVSSSSSNSRRRSTWTTSGDHLTSNNRSVAFSSPAILSYLELEALGTRLWFKYV